MPVEDLISIHEQCIISVLCHPAVFSCDIALWTTVKVVSHQLLQSGFQIRLTYS